MDWIKDIIIDIIALGAISALYFFDNNILLGAVWVYTGLLLVGKILAVFMPSLQKRAQKTETPDWIYHIIYALSIAILLLAQQYYLTGSWALVWLLSIVIVVKSKKK